MPSYGSTGGTVGDDGLPLKLAPLHLPFQRFVQSVLDAGAGPHILSTFGTNTPPVTQVGTSEQAGFSLDAVGDELHAFVDRAEFLDFDLTNNDLRAELKYVNSETSTADPTVDLAVKGVADGEAMATLFTTPDAIRTFNCPGAAGIHKKTALRGMNLAIGVLVADSMIGVGIKLTSLGAGVTTLKFLGVTLYGTRRISSDTGAKEVT